MPKISNDRRSGERRSARLKGCSSRRDENDRNAIEMLDGLSDERYRQLRRLRQERIRGEKDGGADRAIIVGVIARLSRWNGLRRRRARGQDMNGGEAATGAVEMHVPERQHELQRQRGKRQATAKPPVGTNPTHQANAPPQRAAAAAPPSGPTIKPARRDARHVFHLFHRGIVTL